MRIRKMAVLATSVQADVQVGINEWGGAVTVSVSVPRKADEVQVALAPLENLLLRTAQEHVKVADQREAVREQVDEKVKALIESERIRIGKDAEARHAAEDRVRKDHIERLERQLDRQHDNLLHEIETAFYGAEFPGDRTEIMPVIVDVLRSKKNQEKS